MAKNFELQGIVYSIDETRAYGQNGFTKREFVIKLTGDGEKAEYPNYVAFELVKDKCALMDSFNPGDEIQVAFNFSGRLWSAPGKPEKCFTSLQAWRVTRVGGDMPGSGGGNTDYPFTRSAPDYDDDVPF